MRVVKINIDVVVHTFIDFLIFKKCARALILQKLRTQKLLNFSCPYPILLSFE